MAELVVRPTRKWIRFQYTAVFIIFCVAVFVYVNYFPERSGWLLLLPALLFLKPITDSVRRHFTKMTIEGDKLSYETGLLSRSIRTIQLSRVQNVRVDQSLRQRFVSIGDLYIETAGDTGRLTIRNIDEPRAVADQIAGVAHARPQRRKGGS